MRHHVGRCLLLAAVFSIGIACGEGLNTTTGSGGASICDGKESCSECLSCADSNPCRTAMERCQNNSGCTGLDQCIQICAANVQCENECRANNASFVPIYDAWLDCRYCNQCPDDCAGFRQCS